ncbi:choline TMA-lyase-activating enzyme [Neobacillus niacini]|uniref:choline TMA-lyase-activating enzyme n=1 Tax=Neobacillus niacini TaxID=86668 RepID=UPI0021CAE64C|nr:choline TMA-lyase-activating enzyme [Neobacillus niacini]MCM3765648.1 choline TMA-lyase-activating enzyme [Neobacillus niacini]
MTGLIERKAFIFNVQKYNMFDGPGVRTIVFFKGCPLRCKWCANPEGLDRKYQVMLKQSVCTDCGACVPVCPVGMLDLSKGKLEVSSDIDCTGCRKCIDVCPESALSIAGEAKTISELLEIVEEDRLFYEMSGGGITLGGGEVLMQPEAAVNLLIACKKVGINTAIETSGYAKLDSVLQVAEFTDLFLYDIKHMGSERHFELTGVRNERILNNLSELLKRRYNVQIRMPLLKGYNDGKEEIDQVIQFLLPYKDFKNFKGIDLLPYHKFGVNKYSQLGKEYQIAGNPIMTEIDMSRIEGWFKQYDFPVKVVNH